MRADRAERFGPWTLANKIRHRFDVAAARENCIGEYALLDPQVIPEQALEHGSQINRWL